jgi:TatD DNase family protein
MLVDSHCHLDFPGLAEHLPELLSRMADQGVGHALCVGVDLENFSKVLALAESDPRLFASVGLHPDYTDCREPEVEELVSLASHPRVVAIGETGLDYYRLKGDLGWQVERFRIHIRAAKAAGKPLIIHTRSAAEDTLRVMAEEGAGEAGGVMHCFTESLSVAERALDMGFHISFSGIVTFKSAQDLKAVARAVPLSRMLVETDAPYLAPVPHRGRTNEPAYVRHVAEEIARLRDISFEEVAAATTANFFSLFANAVPARKVEGA